MRTDTATLTLSSPMGLTVSIQADRFDSAPPYEHGRWNFNYRIVIEGDPEGPIEGDDLHSGSVRTHRAADLPDALRSLLSFMSAEPDMDLWPAETMERIHMVSDEAAMLSEYLGGGCN